MIRRLIAVLIVVGLAIGVWLLWPREGPIVTATASAVAVSTSPAPSTTTTPGTSTSLPTVTVSTGAPTAMSVEEAEAILRELLLRRYLALYEQDEPALRDLAANQSAFESAVLAMQTVSFLAEPTGEQLQIRKIEVLRADASCLAIWSEVHVSGFLPDGVASGVLVLRESEGQWKWLSLWQHKGDLWESACDAVLELPS